MATGQPDFTKKAKLGGDLVLNTYVSKYQYVDVYSLPAGAIPPIAEWGPELGIFAPGSLLTRYGLLAGKLYLAPAATTGNPYTAAGYGAWAFFSAQTYTDSATAASGTQASFSFFTFAGSTLAATNTSVTTTDVTSVYIGAPVAGTNETFTNAWSLWLAGALRTDGNLTLTNSTAPAAFTDGVRLWSADYAAGDARLYVQSEAAGSPIILGKNIIAIGTGFLGLAISSQGIEIAGGTCEIRLTDTSAGQDDYSIYVNSGQFSIYNATDARYDFAIDGVGNVGIGQTTFDATGVKVLAIGNGTAPAAGLANAVQLWSADYAAGDARLYVQSETGSALSLGNGAIYSAGDLTLRASSGNDVLLGAGTTTIMTVDGGTGTIGFGAAANASVYLFCYPTVAVSTTAQILYQGTSLSLLVSRITSLTQGWVYANSAFLVVNSANTQNWTATVGLRAVGGQLQMLAGSTGTVTGGAAFYALNAVIAGATLTNQYGIYIENLTSGTNDYGIYIVGADTNAIYVAAGATYLGGNLLMGAASIGMSQIAAEPAATADRAFLYALDLAATRCTLGIATEEAVVTEALAAADRSLVIRINGASYKLMLVAV